MIGSGLSLDQSPPLHCSGRFFLTAPVFLVLAVVFFIYSGVHFPGSHMAVDAIALTHFFTLGFILMNMIGALFQLLPVLAGVVYRHPVWLASIVHTGLLIAITGFLFSILRHNTLLMQFSAGLLLIILFFFSALSFWELMRVSVLTPVVVGLRYAMLSLICVILAGWLLSFRYSGWPMLFEYAVLFRIHLLWAFAGWIGILLASISIYIIPMFYVTPEYPLFFKNYFAHFAFGLNLGASICIYFLSTSDFWLLAGSIVLSLICILYSGYAVLTLHIINRRKRKLPDITNVFWRLGLILIPASILVYVSAEYWHLNQLKLLFGVLLLLGSVVTIILAMLYKIVPFLVWFHLFSRGIMDAPNMKQIISERRIRLQLLLHILTIVLFVLVVFWPVLFQAALVLLLVSMGYLFVNIVQAILLYRRHSLK